MRFDLERALAFVSHFDSLRLPGSAAEREAAEVVASEFSKAGLNPRRGAIVGGIPHEPTAVETWLTALLAIAAGVALQWSAGAGPGRSTPWVLATIFLGLAVAGVVLRLVFLGWAAGRRPTQASYVVAEPAPEAGQTKAASARVVFLSHLDTRPPVAAYRFRRDLALLDWVWLAALWVPCLLVGGWAWLMTAGPALLIGLGLITLIRRADPWIQQPGPHPADNRTGLALLIELARSWPRNPQRDLEVTFVAAGLPPDSWPTDLRSELIGATPGVSTLVINLESPGLGEAITLSGQDEPLRFAETAARDLWLPARVSGWSSVLLDHRTLLDEDRAALSLVGDLDSTQIEPRTLAATAQLASELALRWAARSPSPEAVEKSSAG